MTNHDFDNSSEGKIYRNLEEYREWWWEYLGKTFEKYPSPTSQWSHYKVGEDDVIILASQELIK